MSNLRAPPSLAAYGRRDGPVTPEAPTRFSYDHVDRGEPSSIGQLLDLTSSAERPMAFSDDELLPRTGPQSRDASSRGGSQHGGARSRRHRRPPRAPAGGAFLLQEAVVSDDDNANLRRLPRNKGKAPAEPRSATLPQEHGLGIKSGPAKNDRARVVSPDTSQEELLVQKREARHRTGSRGQPSLDVDSTQIVNMALNLSESRRIASRRNISRSNPPRLAPVQDASTGGNLKAHLQQQRKTQRNASPNPNQPLTPRMPAARTNSPRRSLFETGHDSSYRYTFTASTLARAQKAREHLELTAQYRRLLEVLPPLKLGFDQPAASSPPGSPTNGKASRFGSGTVIVTGGREYNPLQYIRNRKVRARERMAIDGEAAGFSDVDSVKSWVDQASASMDGYLSDTGSILPPFAGAGEIGSQLNPESGSKAATRARRPRLDWFFEPCDMIADADWLERDHHKQLIEDRHWNKVFPQTADLSRPLSRQNEEPPPGVTPTLTKTLEEVESAQDMKELQLSRPDTEGSHSSTRERAKQKLHDIGPFHHHHHHNHHRHSASSHSHHDFLRMRKDSLSDYSDSEGEAIGGRQRLRSRRNRAGTLLSNANELLEKQMMEMIAQEEKSRLSHVSETELEHHQPEFSATPEHQPSSKANSGRKWSLTDPSDSDHRSIREKPHDERYHLQKQEFEFPSRTAPRKVEDIDSPQPMSPESHPVHDSLSAPPTRLDLSPPSSRSSSPTRNPFTKVRHIFRDKSKEEGIEAPAIEVGDSDLLPTSHTEPVSPVEDNKTALERSLSVTRAATDGQRQHHRNTGSVRLKGDDTGLRGIFKGPRIDTVIRGGVSRLGDMLWKKENALETPTPAEFLSTDESETEYLRGRRESNQLSRSNSKRTGNENPNIKHFLDTMPQFQHVAEAQGKLASPQLDVKGRSQPSSRPDGPWVPRLEVPKLPYSVPPPVAEEARTPEREMSETESRQGTGRDTRTAFKQPSILVDLPRFDPSGEFQHRKWSINDRGSPQECQLSKREIARLRAIILSSGITAMEITRRAQEPKRPLTSGTLKNPRKPARSNVPGLPWPEIAKLTPASALPSDEPIPFCDHYTTASRALGAAVDNSVEQWQDSADRFTSQSRPRMEERIWCVRSRIADELSGMTGQTADQADETGKDLALGQLLKVKHVIDLIEEMMRNRRRRFRWIRRGMWSVVEWLLVGVMWYVWFIVTIFRMILGVGQNAWRGMRWLLWV